MLEVCVVLDTDMLLVEVDATASEEDDNNVAVSVMGILLSLFSAREKL